MELQALKAAALDQAGDAVIVIDRQGIIRVWNRFAERLFGWTAEQTLGHDVKMIIPESLRAAHDRGLFTAIERGRLQSDGKARHTKALHAEGGNTYVTMTFALIFEPGGRAIGSVAMARNGIAATKRCTAPGRPPRVDHPARVARSASCNCANAWPRASRNPGSSAGTARAKTSARCASTAPTTRSPSAVRLSTTTRRLSGCCSRIR